MARTGMAILRDIKTIKSSNDIPEIQKNKILKELQTELDKLYGKPEQLELELQQQTNQQAEIPSGKQTAKTK